MSGCPGFKFEWQRAFMADDLSPLTKLVLHTLCTYMREDGTGCYPSIETISRLTGLTTRTVRPHLQDAVDRGWIRRWPRKDDGAPLAGKAAQGWRHYQYAAVTPRERGEGDSPPSTERGEGASAPSAERGEARAQNVGKELPPNNQEKNQKKKTERGGARAAAAGAALSLPVFDSLERVAKNESGWLDSETWYFDADDYLQANGAAGIVSIDGEWVKFADRYREQQKTEAAWLSCWKTWIVRSVDHLRGKPWTREQLDANVKAAAAQERRNAEVREQQRQQRERDVKDAADRQAKQARTAAGRTCRHCIHFGIELKPALADPEGSYHHCEAGKGRDLTLLKPGDSRARSMVLLCENRDCDGFQARCVPPPPNPATASREAHP